MELTNPFRQLRESKGQSLREVAIVADLSETVVGRFERDDLLDCRPKTRVKLARGYGVPIEDINARLEHASSSASTATH